MSNSLSAIYCNLANDYAYAEATWPTATDCLYKPVQDTATTATTSSLPLFGTWTPEVLDMMDASWISRYPSIVNVC